MPARRTAVGRAAVLLAVSTLTALATLLPTMAQAVPGGRLGTMPTGRYECALPGDVAGPSVRIVDDASFVILNASSYRTSAGQGSYLLLGESFTFTTGPFAGRRFRRASEWTVEAADPSQARLRCTRRGPVPG